MNMFIKSGLAIFFCMIVFQTQAIFVNAKIYYDPKAKHVVVLIGDIHVNDKRALMQQYDLVKEAAGLKNAQFIVEDLAETSATGGYLASKADYELRSPLKRLVYWLKKAGIEALNVDHRYTTNIAPVFMRAQNLDTFYNKIKDKKNVFSDTEYVAEIHSYIQNIVLPKIQYIKYYYLMAAVGSATKNFKRSLFTGGVLVVDLYALDELAQDRKKGRISFYVAGAAHTQNIELALKGTGLYHLVYEQEPKTIEECVQAQRISYCKLDVEPIDIAALFGQLRTLLGKNAFSKKDLQEKYAQISALYDKAQDVMTLKEILTPEDTLFEKGQFYANKFMYTTNFPMILIGLFSSIIMTEFLKQYKKVKHRPTVVK